MLMKATAMDMMSIGNFMDGMPDVVFDKASNLKVFTDSDVSSHMIMVTMNSVTRLFGR